MKHLVDSGEASGFPEKENRGVIIENREREKHGGVTQDIEGCRKESTKLFACGHKIAFCEESAQEQKNFL